MKKLAAARSFKTYNPEHELRTRHQGWTLEVEKMGRAWAKFGSAQQVVVVNQDYLGRDRELVLAHVVALLDAGLIQDRIPITAQDDLQAGHLARLRLDRPILWPAEDFIA